MAQQGINKGDVLLRLAGPSFIVGAILLVVFNILHPRPDDPSVAAQMVQKIAENRGGFWEVVNLLLAVGIWAFMIGAAGVYRSISAGSGAVFARLGFYGIIVGTALWSALFALMGFGLPLVVEEMQNATGTTAATLGVVASSLVGMTTGLFSMTIIVYWLAFIFLGAGMALSRVYPKLLGWVGVVLGVATVGAVGLPQAFAGPSDVVTNLLFPILATISTAWGLAIGIWLVRKAW
ncbi:MAG: hypothetical protein HY676_04320 [Chloroflexi bacterium]|nr:hypothetical protein [Chloroflexota bacterium]